MKKNKRTLVIVAIVAIAAVLCALALILGQPWKNAQGSLMNPDDPSVTTPVDPIAPFVPDTPPEVADGVITRGEMEAALAEVAWDYFVKGVKVQYDSMDLNTRNDGTNEPLSKYSGGFWRTTTTSTLEDADSDTYLFTVCSDYAWNVYYEALGYPILGNRLNCHTSQFWRGTEAPDDMVVLRWHNKGKGVYLSDYDDDYGMTFDDWYELEDLKNFLMNWKETLRPGDIITQRTGNSAHTVLYVGNGMILHSNGDGKYNMVKGTDKPETEGSISMNYVEDYYFTEGNIFNLDAMQRSSSQAWICVVRPLDILTKDDGDSDPSNDVLDPDYVLDTGKLNAQLSIDPRPLQTSGYTIKDTTFTRMAYPGMDIDRTVDITPYGTVAKDGTLTYTIEISNKSTNPQYVTYRSYGQSKLYVGEAYEGLIIEEHVPENTVLVSAPGAYVEGGTLRWQVDIPRGKSVVLTYTVKVTGEIGDKIVNGGGLVANIPSNTLTNIIGGAKLSEEALQNMDSFAQASKSKWNSNDGYKITAAMTAGTVFAERIYNETTGLDLQLPEIQELIDILFNYEKINVKQGLYLAHGTGPDSPGVTRYMYTLNKTTADPANQVYRDMVIDGYFGGVWAFSNDYAGEPRIYEFRTDYLEPGDIIIHTMLTPSNTDGAAEETRKVEEWNVVVYLGNSTFASLSSDGRLKKIKDDSAIVPGFSYDLFVALRPSQAYANINTDVAAFIGPAKDLTDEDMATGYEGNISDVLLNDKNSAALAALKASDFSQYSGKFIGEVYSKIGLDVVTDGTMNSSYSTVVKALFADNPNDSSSATFMEYGREYHLLEEPLGGTEKLYDMLIYYGGPAFVDSEDIASLSDLHPGDAIMLGRGISALDEPLVNFGSMDVVAVYQGDGKFLVSIRDLAGTYYGTPDYRQWTTKSFSSDEEFTSWLAAPIVDGNSDLFEGYVVLRPSRVFEDVNTMAYAGDNSIVADGSQISSNRSITDRVLNNAEKLLMANLTVADWFAAEMPTNLIKIPSWIYSKQLNIKDISNYFDQTMFYLRNGLFYKSGSWYHLSDMSRANHVEKYHQMMVSKRYGGFNIELSRTLKESDFQIGDLFCAWTVDKYGKNIYWVGLYQGNYQFLLIRNGGTDSIKVAEEAYLTEFNARISNGDYAFYFILRPEQLAGGPRIRDIADGELTAKEKKGLSEITVEDWKYSGKKNNQGAALWFYNEINVNIAKNFDKSVFNMMYAIFNEKTWKPNGPDHANYQKYVRMLVSDYYGGIKFGKVGKTFKSDGSDFEIGDLFCAYTEVLVEGAKKRAYYVGLYQGNGKFLMTQTGYGVETDAYVDSRMVYASNIASKFMCYYVIRPNQLNREIAPVELRDITTGVLTDAEKKSLSALTVNQYNAVGTTAANQKLVSWAYGEAGVDVSASFDQSVFNLMKKIFEGDGTEGRTPIPSDSANYIAKYGKMLVDGYYGGTEVKTADKLFTAADFQVGDVFCAVYYPDPSSTTKCYYAGIYLGDGKFLMSCSDGGWSAKIDTELVFKSTLAEEMGIYFILRPELLALPDEPVVELRDITTGVLTDAEKALLSALTVEKYTAAGTDAANQKLAVWAYKEAGVDVSASFDQSVFNLMKKIFEGDGTEGRTPIPSDSANYIAKYGKMLVDGYYGGTEVKTADKLFTAADFQVGDVFCAVYYPDPSSTTKCYYAGIYLGDGKFLMSCSDGGWSAKIDTELVFKTTLAEEMGIYFILRPELLALPDEPVVELRDITTGVLTDAEKALLSALTVEKYTAAGTDAANQKLAVWAYKEAGVDVSASFDQSVFNLMKKIFEGDGTEGRTPIPSDSANYIAKYGDMLVDGYYGGTEVKTADKLFTAADFQVGDLFCAVYYPDPSSTTKKYYAGIYLGDGKFLMSNSLSGNWEATIDTELVFKSTLAEEMGIYFVLRPELLAPQEEPVVELRDITTGVLTDAEKALLSALTVEKYTAAGTDAANQKLAVWAYKEAGVDVSASFDQSVFNLMKKIFEGDGTEGRTPIPSDSANYIAKYGDMLVDGYYGGTEVKTADKLFTAADFQVGDLFCAVYYPDPSSTTKKYYAGIYLGDGKFLMSNSLSGNWEATIDTELVFKTTLAEEMGIYFVLRPELLAPQEEPVVELRDITTGVLTDAEKALLSALTVEKYTAAGTDAANQKLAVWAYKEAGVDVSASFDQSVFNLMKKIFEGDGTEGRTPIPSDSANYIAKYGDMLVDGYYGGTEVKTADKLFTAADFQVGDLFCAVYYPDPSSTTKCYYAGIYLGDGKFLMSCSEGGWSAKIDTELVFKTTLAEEMGIYFVLSPEQLAPRADGELTVAVQRKLSALTAADLDAANKTNDTGVIKWFCQQEGMTSDDVKNFSSILSMSNSLFNKTGTWTYKTGDTTYHKLFVDGYYGGIKFGAENSKTFTKADFKVGDIFCVQAPNGDSTRYYVGMYQGDGQFLMYDRTGASNYVDTTMAFGNIAETCNYYFVLRPSQYIYSAN